MRAVFLVLLVVNLLFLAWARWIDGPREEVSQDSLSRLPRLELMSEAPHPKPTAAEAAPVSAEKVALVPASPARTCMSFGPFNGITSAARAAGLLSQHGFHLQQRAEEGETIEGYWVFVGGLQSDDEAVQVVNRLEKSGFTDAHVMKQYSTNRRLSVGMFSSRERAEKRAAAVRNLGLQPEIGERKFSGTIYWVDVDLPAGTGAKQLPPDYALADIGHPKVGMQPCPQGLRPADPSVPDVSPDEDNGVINALPRTTVASAPKGPGSSKVP